MTACRLMETRTCPTSYDGPCGERPCARFESDDETPWQWDLKVKVPIEIESASRARLDAMVADIAERTRR